MRIEIIGSSFLILYLIVSGAAAKASQQSASPSTALTPAAANTTIPSYPNTLAGLERLVKDMMKLGKKGEYEGLALYAKSLALPEAENWFKSVFGEERGRALAAASDRARSQIELGAPNMLAEMFQQKQVYVQAVLLDDSCNGPTTPEEYSILFLRQRPEVLYDVRFSDGSSTVSIWKYFAYVGGGFRYVGNLRKEDAQIQRANLVGSGQSESTGPSPKKTRVISVGGNVQATQLVCQVIPIYPQEAKEQGIQGKVILHATIDVDGTIEHLEPISGPPDLIEPSMQAVQRWRYRPTLLLGEPVAVDTTITVVFMLRS